MSKCFVFCAGILTGAYIAQNYKIPKVTTMVESVYKKISEYEKKDGIKK